MTTLEEIEKAVEKAVEELPLDQRRQFFDWIEELKAELWDRQIEEDAKAGVLDKLADELWGDEDAAELDDGAVWRKL